jgi:hypothetical protein
MERARRISSKLNSPGDFTGNCEVRRAIGVRFKIMKIIVTQYSFVESFRACGRGTQFSSHALRALFEHLERVEEDTDTELELDPIALCCEWAEYATALDAAKDYGYLDGVDSKDEDPIEWLTNRTDCVRVWENGVIVRNF